jgi:hypothetical protein
VESALPTDKMKISSPRKLFVATSFQLVESGLPTDKMKISSPREASQPTR